MSTQMGVWIDQRQARIVRLDDDEVTLHTIDSDVEREPKSLGHAGGVPAGGKTPSSEPRHLEHRREQEFKAFFSDVIKAVSKADELVIIGPGMTRTHLSKRMQEEGLDARIRTVDSAPTGLSDAQLKKHIKEMFGRHDPRMQVR
jgi:stalled ribosome rescue protein Dom34